MLPPAVEGPALALEGGSGAGWVLAAAAATGVLVSIGLAKLMARRRPSNWASAPEPRTPPTPTYLAARPVMGPVGAVSRYFSQRLGRRGTLLTLFGLAYGTYGAGQFLSGRVTRFGDLGPLSGLANSHAIGWIWIAGGLTGVIVGLQPRKKSDGLGFVGVFIPLVMWTCLYDISWVVGLATGDDFGNSRAWVTSIVWAVQTAVVLVTAGWPDPEMGSDGVTGE